MKKKDKPIVSYEAAMTELKEIVAQFQEEAVSIDELSEQVKRAAALIQYCREKLRATEEEVNGLF